MNRREFISGGAILGATGVMGSARADARAAGAPFRVCVFADLHYTPGVYTNDDPEFLEKILTRAEAERCDMVIHLGDMVQNVAERSVRKLVERYNSFRIPAFHVIGNHEQDGTTHEEVLQAFGMERGYYSVDRGGFRFIVLDPNYFCNAPGKFIHFTKGNYFHRSIISTINWIPPEQVEWLKEMIDTSPHPCAVFAHQSFERGPAGSVVCNADEIRNIFAFANAKTPGKVRLVVNGHMHVDHLRILDNIAYWDVNSANMFYWGPRQRAYPHEYLSRHSGAPYTFGSCEDTLGWKEPLSAILTLYPGGRIKIDGSKSEWLFGITPKEAGFSEYDCSDRLISPVIKSADFTLNPS